MCQVDDAAVEQCRWCEATHQDKHVGGKRKTSHWVWLLEFIWSEGVTVFHSWLNWLWKRWELIYDLLTINRISFDLWAGLKSSARLTLSALRHPLLQFSCFDPHVKTSAASTFFLSTNKGLKDPLQMLLVALQKYGVEYSVQKMLQYRIFWTSLMLFIWLFSLPKLCLIYIAEVKLYTNTLDLIQRNMTVPWNSLLACH